jgi:hypothetical protein
MQGESASDKAQDGETVQVQRGIPTQYGGVQFRSRIEAKWAAFFDALGWGWQYEPIDLAGYIPDFVLEFQRAPLLVEVKSALRLPDALHPHKAKIAASAWDGEALIVGAKLGFLHGGEYLCGILGSRESIPKERTDYVHLCQAHRDFENDLEWLWDDAALFWCVACRGPSLCQYNGSWRCRRCGIDDGQHRGNLPDGLINDAWREAGNAVQWKGKRP